MSSRSADQRLVVGKEWVELADIRDKSEPLVHRGRARSNSFCISSLSEAMNSPLILSPQEALYYHTKDVMSRIPPPLYPNCDPTNVPIYRISNMNEDSSFYKSEEFLSFSNSRKPTLRVSFVNFSDTDLSLLLSFFPAEHVTKCCSGLSSIDYYCMVAKEHSLSFNIILCQIHNHCAECVQTSILNSSHLIVLMMDMLQNENIQKIDSLLTKHAPIPFTIIGVTDRGLNSLSETEFRSLLSNTAQFSYAEAFFKSKKKMKRIVDSISQNVIQSQYNLSELNSSNCIIIVYLSFLYYVVTVYYRGNYFVC